MVKTLDFYKFYFLQILYFFLLPEIASTGLSYQWRQTCNDLLWCLYSCSTHMNGRRLGLAQICGKSVSFWKGPRNILEFVWFCVNFCNHGKDWFWYWNNQSHIVQLKHVSSGLKKKNYRNKNGRKFFYTAYYTSN